METIPQRIKGTISRIDPDAKVLLYGSRARGTANADSDWDILILVNKPMVNLKDEQIFRHTLFELELETGEVISTFVYALDDWNTRLSVTPLYKIILKEAIAL